MGHRDRRLNVLLFLYHSTTFNNFHQGLTWHTVRAILRIRHHRIHINALLRVSISKDVTHIKYNENRMSRILRSIGNFLGQSSCHFLRNFNVHAKVNARRISDEQYGIKVLLRQRRFSNSRSRRSGRRKGGTQRCQTICRGS